MSKSKRSSESAMRVRRTFTEEFKHDPVSLVVDQGYTLAAAARSLGLHPNLIRNWKQKFMSKNNGQAVLSEDHEAERACEKLLRWFCVGFDGLLVILFVQ